jgi:hypothetical protein
VAAVLGGALSRPVQPAEMLLVISPHATDLADQFRCRPARLTSRPSRGFPRPSRGFPRPVVSPSRGFPVRPVVSPWFPPVVSPSRPTGSFRQRPKTRAAGRRVPATHQDKENKKNP